MQQIPLDSIPAQTITVLLNQQNCDITVYTLTTGLYLDLSVNGSPIVEGVLCHDRCKIVRDTYLGFSGDLSFVDTQAKADPVYTEFGSRYFLLYLDPADL